MQKARQFALPGFFNSLSSQARLDEQPCSREHDPRDEHSHGRKQQDFV
jgi:hypothetical protein